MIYEPRFRLRDIISIIIAVMSVISCQKVDFADVSSFDGEGSNVSVHIRMSSFDDIACPVSLYAFSADGSLLESRVQESADANFDMVLPRGTTTHVAALYAPDDSYTIENPLTSSACVAISNPHPDASIPTFIRQLLKGYVHTQPLCMACADVTPSTSSSALHLLVQPCMASLVFNVEGIPSRCEASYITISALSQAITLEGNLTGTQKSIIPLTRLSDSDTWTSGIIYLFPSAGNRVNITITYDDERGEQFAQTTYPMPLRAGKRYTVNSVLSNHILTVSDTDIPEIPDEDDVYEVSTLPEPPCIWQGHVVVRASRSDTNMATLDLVSLSDFAKVSSALHSTNSQMAGNIAEDYSEYGIANWHIPSPDEAKYLRDVYISADSPFASILSEAGADSIATTDDKGRNVRYLCDDAKQTYSFNSGSSYNSILAAGASVNDYHLRLVTSVRVRVVGNN